MRTPFDLFGECGHLGDIRDTDTGACDIDLRILLWCHGVIISLCSITITALVCEGFVIAPWITYVVLPLMLNVYFKGCFRRVHCSKQVSQDVHEREIKWITLLRVWLLQFPLYSRFWSDYAGFSEKFLVKVTAYCTVACNYAVMTCIADTGRNYVVDLRSIL